ncbi:hypothetical protein K439DRAFT_847509 [Ramaria rubella]|nr:hypothetical protein K439DRAFT_847509 [Ramaria rubella]
MLRSCHASITNIPTFEPCSASSSTSPKHTVIDTILYESILHSILGLASYAHTASVANKSSLHRAYYLAAAQCRRGLEVLFLASYLYAIQIDRQGGCIFFMLAVQTTKARCLDTRKADTHARLRSWPCSFTFDQLNILVCS